MTILQNEYSPDYFLDTITGYDIQSYNLSPDKQVKAKDKALVTKLSITDVPVFLKSIRTMAQLREISAEFSDALRTAGAGRLNKGAIIAWPNSGECPGRIGAFRTFDWTESSVEDLRIEGNSQVQEFKNYVDEIKFGEKD